MTRTLETAQEVVAKNLEGLMKDRQWRAPQLAQHSGVSRREVYFILRSERECGINMLDRLARPFGLSGWELMLHHEDVNLLKTGQIGHLCNNYIRANDQGREHIRIVADREATFSRN